MCVKLAIYKSFFIFVFRKMYRHISRHFVRSAKKLRHRVANTPSLREAFASEQNANFVRLLETGVRDGTSVFVCSVVLSYSRQFLVLG